MGARDETEQTNFSLPSLRLRSMSPAVFLEDSPQHPSTPPLQTLASVPFQWEEKPGKPRPCTRIMNAPEPFKCLELPPCRVFAQTPSPTSVLDGPRSAVLRTKFSSFRLFREGHQDSFESSPEEFKNNPVDAFRGGGGVKSRRLLEKFRIGKKDFEGGSFRLSSSSGSGSSNWENEEMVASAAGVKVFSYGEKMKRKGSFSSIPHPRPAKLLGTLYKGLKQVIQWKSSRKCNKDERDSMNDSNKDHQHVVVVVST